MEVSINTLFGLLVIAICLGIVNLICFYFLCKDKKGDVSWKFYESVKPKLPFKGCKGGSLFVMLKDGSIKKDFYSYEEKKFKESEDSDVVLWSNL